MFEIRMRVGPKGQVVIPKRFRDAFGIGPGTEVTFSIEGERIVMRIARTDTAYVLEGIAKSARPLTRSPPHPAYGREMRRRPIPRLEDLAGSLSKYATARKVKESLKRAREEED